MDLKTGLPFSLNIQGGDLDKKNIALKPRTALHFLML